MNFKEVYPEMITSVMKAAATNQVSELQELISNGRSVVNKDNQGWTALHHSCHNGYLECVKLLLQSADIEVNALSFENETPLKLLFSNCKEINKPFYDITEALLNAGANPNYPTSSYWSLPFTSALEANLNLEAKLLAEWGADIDKEDKNHGYPLHIAARCGNEKMFVDLLQRGASITSIGEHNFTVLHTLTLYHTEDNDSGCASCLQLILDHPEGASLIDKPCIDGATPLMLACQTRWVAGANLLLDRGADVNIKTNLEAEDFALCGNDYNCNSAYALCMATQFFSPHKEAEDKLFCRILDATNSEMLLSTPYIDDELGPLGIAVDHKKTKFLGHIARKVPVANCFGLVQFHDPFKNDEFKYDGKSFNLELEYRSGNLITLILLDKQLDKEVNDTTLLLVDKGVPVVSCDNRVFPPLTALLLQKSTIFQGGYGESLMKAFLQKGADPHDFKGPFPIPPAFFIAFHFNPVALFKLCQLGCPIDQVFHQDSAAALKQFYLKNRYSEICPSFVCRVISYMRVLSIFLPCLPQSVHELISPQVSNFYLWSSFLESIYQPKSLLHLSVLRIRKILSNTNGWKNLPFSLSCLIHDVAVPVTLVNHLHMEHIHPPPPVLPPLKDQMWT